MVYFKLFLNHILKSCVEDGIMGITFHLPMSDENCLGRYAWCGTGQPVTPDVLRELTPRFFSTDDPYNYCINSWINFRQSPTTIGNFYREGCDFSYGGNMVSKNFFCVIPA
jgi:hypothetical protein